ncbi:lamin tail domain-containing protein [Marinifilum fragile]|uniref:lamin tail domain-containing protein n=1 Tax=Marinifilum fragile TaxID=570161 RepID=UPI002AA773B6|nr:lamin tail domain-containing protein [Marinifilum fragile]
MKKTLSQKLFILLVLLINTNLHAEDIWTRNFSDAADLNKGYWGANVDMEGVAEWSLDVTNCTLADDSDYVKVVETSGGRLEAVDCDGEAVWMSKAIDISSYSNCSIAVLVVETGSSTSANKYLKCFYKIDDGAEQLFTVNGENVGNWGSSDASTSGLEGGELRIIVRMNNPNAGDKVYFDNIVVSGDPIIVENDNLTVLKESGNQVGEVTINSDVDTEAEALPCFRFIIDETDSASDGVPTKISRMTFYNSNLENGLDWENQLGGIGIYSEGNWLNYKTMTIGADSIYIDFSEDQLTIPEGAKREFELRAYLNSANELLDGLQLQLAIRKDAIGFSTFASGSGFAENNDSISSAIHLINVEATQLVLKGIPESVVRNQLFQFSVEAKDQFGNMDSDKEEQISLSLQSGKGELIATNGLSKNLVIGSLVFDSLRYQAVDTIRLMVVGESLPELISSKIVIENTYESQADSTSWIPENTFLSALYIQKSDAFKLFEFAIKDSGDDEAPTVLKKIPIASGESNQADFKRSLTGFYLMRDNRELDVDFVISKDKIDIFFQESEPAAIVNSESETTYSLFAYFKEGACVDKEIIQLRIEKSSEKWEISEEDSGLKPQFDNEILGPKLECEVKAVQMQFGTIPKTVKPNELFTVEVELLDELGNLDTDFDKQVEISLAAGTGELKSQSGLRKTMDNGKMIWTDLVYDKAEHFTIQAEAEGFETILSEDISSVDQNSMLIEGETIVNHQLTSLSVTEETASTVLNFSIADSASFDDLPTLINTAIFYKKELPNSFDWEKHIAGAIIKSDGEILAISNDIDNERIKFNSSKGLFQVSNGTVQKFELAIYFKESSLPDNKEFQAFIPKSDSGWKTGINSSELKGSLLKDINSEILILKIEADRLSIVSSPLFVEDNAEQFNLKVVACDQYQNIDVDHSDKISLELIQGDGELIHDTELDLNNGILNVNSISYSGKKDFKLRVHSSLGSDSCTIVFGQSLLDLNYDFEEHSLGEFINSTDWSISTYQPIHGNKSLKHNLSNQIGNSYISRKLENWRSENGITRWSFVLRNGDWDPSSGNNFVFHLCMDDENPAKAKVKYSVGVNLKGSSDILSLWKTNNGETPEVLAQTKFDWNENEAIAIQIEYNASGTWSLAYNRMGESNSWYKFEGFSSEITDKSEEFYCGLEFNFESATRAGELWFDDFRVQSVNTAPFIKSYQISGQDSIIIAFSEQLKADQQLTHENFKISCNDEELKDFKFSITDSGSEILIIMNSELKTGKYQVEVLNITDKDGAILDSDSIIFEYLAPANVFDVVFNEIMADESPTQGLPEYEYIELYNTKSYPISVEGWKLQIGSKELLFSSDTIQANSYLIICSNSAVALFSEHGNALGLSNFTGLTNSGNSLRLLSANGETIDEIAYSDIWYQSEEKSTGGWSLERIDPSNICSSQSNWSASVNEKGGTPGQVNSIRADYVDEESPKVVSFKLVSKDQLTLEFGEMIDEATLLNSENYNIQANALKEVTPISTQGVELQFENSFTDAEQMQLYISGIADECGNVLDTILDFVYHEIHEHDVVFNEIMADESPTQGLPEYEYIELYNTKSYPISVEGWKLQIGSMELWFSSDTIQANSYLILCSNTAIEAFSEYGNTLGLSNFSGLSNSGNSLKLLSANGEIIEEIVYSDTWYQSEEKSNDGWSLERIDPSNICSSRSNWSASVNEKGGTPGQVNSIRADYVDEESPKVVSFKLVSKDQLALEFSEMIDEATLLNPENYNIQANALKEVTPISTQGVELQFENSFTDAEQMQLHVSGISDECGNVLDTILDFVYHEIHEHDVIINEIMADESPTQGLPEYEYIELYNTKGYPISVEGWKLQIGSKELLFSSDTIHANSYLILCSNTAVELFSEYGNTLGLSNFTGLTNSGNSLRLLSANGETIDEIAYSDTWYQSEEKSNGGWSLERIDPANICSSQSNWSASVNEKGGTPGQINSIHAENIDKKAPKVISFKLVSENQLALEFSEMIDEATLLNPENYNIQANALKEVTPISTQGVELQFENSFTDAEQMQLYISGIADECDNVLDTIFNFVYHEVHEHDVVINEIMADESPTQGLPEYEYIELYNTKGYPISVEGWKLQIGSKELLFSSDTIYANSYLILCSNTAVEAFSEYGNAIGLSNFTGLTNSGNSLKLLSANGETIDEIVYSDTWYQSEEKSNGGWSLERIDPMNFTWQEPNWKASNATNGGTPGKLNSVFAENKDQVLPQIEDIEVVNTNTVRVIYSEPMQVSSVLQKSNYKLVRGDNLIQEIRKLEEAETIIEIVFKEHLLENAKFKLEISQNVTDLAGNPLKNNLVEFWIPTQVHQGDIVINEILFDPLSGGSDYIELYNRTQNVYDLSQLYIGKKDESYLLTDSVKLAKQQILLHPESYCLFTADSSNVAENYYTSNTSVFHQVDLPNYPDKNGRIVLYTKGELIDDLEYCDDMHFELLASKEGVALERVNPDNETNLNSNWQSAAQNIGFGTPGMKNSVYSDIEESVEEVSLSSKIFSPDNDGVDDRLYINFNLKDDGFVANIRIYNSLGKEIRKLASNLYLGTDDSVYWDGLNSKRERLPIGIYLVYIEMFNPDGRMKTYKKTCVIGGKLK